MKKVLASLPVLLLAFACGRTELFPRTSYCVFDSDCPIGQHCVNRLCMELSFPDAGEGPGGKRFGEPCDGGAECASSFCVGGPTGAFCTEPCDAGSCPNSLACKRVPDPNDVDGGVLLSLCAVAQPLLCQSCEQDEDCGASLGDSCLRLEGGAFCGRDCTHDGCPDLFECRAMADGRNQCAPRGRTCDCIPETVGMKKTCASTSAAGTCPGWQQCQVDGGFTACTAVPAVAETCNAVDDDCDGVIDDLPPSTCTRTAGGRTCVGPQVCTGTLGLRCDAPTPTAETCDYEDDDCNALVDDGFTDDAGRYVQRRHCGGCNNDCDGLHPSASATTCALNAAGAPECRATACKTGFFLPSDGGTCLRVADSLCRPCTLDADCTGPNSRCVTGTDGLKFCGRDCTATGPFGASCPTGYACQTVNGERQCMPQSGTCSCTNANLGASRSCAQGTCNGFEFCRAAGSGTAWSVCDVASYNPEICDGTDNNCNGQLDEGFRNAATGKYEANAHCGFCNNDCTKMWSPTLQHTTGVCNTTPAMPTCVMGPCLKETVGGTTFEWVNVNGDTDDGCECRRVNNNTSTDLPDRMPGAAGSPSYVDENCDGVDGVIADAIFVSATAGTTGNGSRTTPFRTLAQGLAALGGGKRYVLVAQGIYRENVTLQDGAQLFGGYSSDFLKRDPTLHTSIIEGQPGTASALGAVHAANVGRGLAVTVVSGFTIRGQDAAAAGDGLNGEPSVGVYVRDSGGNLFITNNVIEGGAGGRGGRGLAGAQGFGRQVSFQLNGQAGIAAPNSTGTCFGVNRPGGAPGTNSQCFSGNAFRGGNAVCPQFTFGNPTQGAQQAYTSPTSNGNGRGGFDWSFDNQSGPTCSHVTESGFPTNIQPHDGQDGQNGDDGVSGTAGGGAPSRARHGSVSGGRWVSSPFAATAGGAGTTGVGGGGGGAGGGTARMPGGLCQEFEVGPSGGGGGAGACGGLGGGRGGAGGASIAVFFTFTVSPGAAVPQLSGNRISRGLGGGGGNGGFGGAGGQGGAGGFGGNGFEWHSAVGGKGGEGGNGGAGGGGGGGAGGPSYGIFGFNAQLAGYAGLNTFLTPGTAATGGAGGQGGSSPGSTATGTAGSDGASSDLLILQPCALGCGAGTSCDANGVCAPN